MPTFLRRTYDRWNAGHLAPFLNRLFLPMVQLWIIFYFRTIWPMLSTRSLHYAGLQVPRRGACQLTKLDVAYSDHIPVRRLRRHCAKYILWSGHHSHLRHDGKWRSRCFETEYTYLRRPKGAVILSRCNILSTILAQYFSRLFTRLGFR